MGGHNINTYLEYLYNGYSEDMGQELIDSIEDVFKEYNCSWEQEWNNLYNY